MTVTAPAAPSWQTAYLTALGAKPTPAAVGFLNRWQPYEGGATHNNASYNYLNTTQRLPGSRPVNSVGVQAYGSLDQGAHAFARTLLGNPNYAGLVSYLRTGQGDPTGALATWVSGSPSSAHGLSYAQKVLGSTGGGGSVATQAAAPSGGGGGVDLSPLLAALAAARTLPPGLPAQAQQLAGRDVAATVAGIRGQQAQIVKDAAARAQQQALLAQTSARFLQGLNLGGAVAGDYRAAAADQRAAAAGYSGGLQQTVGDAAAKVQANLARTGSADTAHNLSPQAGNVLYGLGGNLPAESLDVVGPTVAAGLRALPASTLAYGQAQARGALGAGQQAAARLDPTIAAAQAKRSTVAADYLGQLEKAALASGQNQVADTLNVLKLQQQGIAQQALGDYRQASIQAREDAIAAANSRSAAGITAANARAAAALKVRQKAATTGKTPQLSALQVQKYKGTAATIAENAFKGFTTTDKTGTQTAHPAIGYNAAIEEMRKEGVPLRIAVPYLNMWYPAGQRGRPVSRAQQREAAGLGLQVQPPPLPVRPAAYTIAGPNPGLVAPGNVDIMNRPIAHNADGSNSTVRSISIGTDHGEVLIPTVINGKVVSDQAAIAYYKRTGQNLGTFKTIADANAYAVRLHNQQASLSGGK